MCQSQSRESEGDRRIKLPSDVAPVICVAPRVDAERLLVGDGKAQLPAVA